MINKNAMTPFFIFVAEACGKMRKICCEYLKTIKLTNNIENLENKMGKKEK